MSNLVNLPIRQKIDRIEAVLKQMPEQLDLPPVHHFSRGLYARELFIPKGTLIVGKIHRYECLNTMLGDISVLTEEGVKRLTGFHTFTSRPGVKRVGFTHEDTTWICYHASKETDIDKLEDELIAKSYDEVCLDSIEVEALTGGAI